MTNFDRNNPMHALIEERYLLTKKNSSKETWHLRLRVDSQTILDYEPGDSIGILAENDPILVEHLLNALNATGQELVTLKRSGHSVTLQTFLNKHANLSRLTSSFLQFFDHHQEISTLLLPENKPSLRAFLQEKDPLHILRDFGGLNHTIQGIVDQFGPLLPRFYSIASSPRYSPGTIDLTIATFNWLQDGQKRYGVASHFLCHLAKEQETPIPFFIHKAPHFRLPHTEDTPIIMIGPGTGVAPFRAFIQHRHTQQSSGKQWLFFGERNQETDFYYEKEWKQFPKLQLDTAFSRDDKTKTYVQHRLKAAAEALYSWIESGAHIYVCGDAKQMAKDVEETLVDIIAEYSHTSTEKAKQHLKELKKQGRYCLDVY